MKKALPTLNILFLVMTVFISYLSNSKILNGESMGSISAQYHNLFTPAGYAFSIWGLIYIGLFSFVIYYGPFGKQTTDRERTVLNIGWWFVISCITNSLWVICWIYNYTLITIFLMVFLLISLMKILSVIEKEKNTKIKFFLHYPFAIYAGWISVALIANVAAYLTKIHWGGLGLDEAWWAILLFLVAGALHLLVLWKKNLPAFSLVSVWALIAIAIENQASNKTVYTFAFTVAMIVFSAVLLSFFIHRKAVK